MTTSAVHEIPTRRDYLTGTGVAAAAGLLAGCADGEHYPALPAAERLFDRDRVAAAITDAAR